MTMKTMKLALAAVAVLGAGAVMAQEFGDGKKSDKAKDPAVAPAKPASDAPVNAETPAEPQEFVQSADGAMAQDQKSVDFDNENELPENVLAKLMESEDTSLYDDKTGRILVLSTVTFDVRNPKVSTDFIGERVSRMMELLMNAKAEIVKTICSKMSAERVLALPANPIRNKLQKEEDNLRAQIEYTKSLLDEAGVALQDAKLDTKQLSIPELMAAMADMAKSDYAKKLDGEKKDEFAVAKKEYKKIEDEYKQLLELAKEKQAEFSDNLQQKSGANLSLTAEMQIHGCTVLEQAEGSFLKDGKWQYQISALFSWSAEGQKAAEAILNAKKTTFVPGKHTVTEWLNHYAKIDPKKGGLADWMGPRTYIDKKGDMWYLGIYPAASLSNAREDDKAVKAAALMARAEVGFALYADLMTTNAYESLHLDMNIGGETVSKKLEDYSEKTTEEFKNLVLYGVGKVGPTYNLKHSTGHNIHVVVYGVNASNADEMKSIHANAHKLGLSINTAQESERGRLNRMNEQTRASKDNAAARAVGAQQADQEAAEAFKARAAAERKRQAREAAPSQPQQEKGLKKGTRFIRATDDF